MALLIYLYALKLDNANPNHRDLANRIHSLKCIHLAFWQVAQLADVFP